MYRRSIEHLAVAMILGAVCLPASSSTAQESSWKKQDQTHACINLIKPLLYRARTSARKLAARNVEAQVLDITKRLGREPQFQQTLECLMRHQKSK